MKSHALKPEDQVSHYQVVSLLGAGGMGEVYEARDASLGRAVALKVLPIELVRDGLRLQRFVQEAKSASSLSHPNIITIHEIGQAEIPSGDRIHFIAMELVVGRTVRELIVDPKTELRSLLRGLTQAAEGLAKAHAAGIVHRDLKPENIMVSTDGFAKVLDFGLAKLTERPGDGGQDQADSPTATAHRTGEGVVLGTIGYMSPEQVLGKSVDARSDIFSFGCILYEAATRKKPFAADTSIETMHRILRDKPTAIEELNADVPAELRRLIRRCLAKEPNDRLQSMRDLAIELKEIVDEYDSLPTPSNPSAQRAAVSDLPVRGRWTVRRAGIATALVLVVVALVGAIWIGARSLSPAVKPDPARGMKVKRLGRFDNLLGAATSPDGRFLAYALRRSGRYSLWVRQIATASDIEILKEQGEAIAWLMFSPDGNYLYYNSPDPANLGYRILCQVPSIGGTARKLVFNVDSPVAFSPDGSHMAFIRWSTVKAESHLFVTNVDGSVERDVAATKPPHRMRESGLAWSPDGQRIAVACETAGIGLDLVTFSASDGRQERIGGKSWRQIEDIAWLPDGTGLVVTGQPGDPEPAFPIWIVDATGGEPRQLTSDVDIYINPSLSADGRTLTAVQRHVTGKLWLVPLAEPSAARELTRAGEEIVGQITGTASGAIVFRMWNRSRPAMWSVGEDGRDRRALLPDDLVPIGLLPPAPRRAGFVVFTAVRADRIPHVWRVDPDGQNLTQLTHGEGESIQAVTPDGSTMLTTDGNGVLWKSAVAGGSLTRISDRAMFPPRYSPDGKMLLRGVTKPEGRLLRWMLELVPADGGGPLRTLDLSLDMERGFLDVRWAPDGNALTRIREINGVGNIWSHPLNGGPERQLTRFESGHIWQYDFTGDGKSIAASRGETRADVVQMTGFE